MLSDLQYPLMKLAYKAAISLADRAERFERYVFRWLALFEEDADPFDCGLVVTGRRAPISA